LLASAASAVVTSIIAYRKIAADIGGKKFTPLLGMPVNGRRSFYHNGRHRPIIIVATRRARLVL
jgi:hypothetical protein